MIVIASMKILNSNLVHQLMMIARHKYMPLNLLALTTHTGLVRLSLMHQILVYILQVICLQTSKVDSGLTILNDLACEIAFNVIQLGSEIYFILFCFAFFFFWIHSSWTAMLVKLERSRSLLDVNFWPIILEHWFYPM